MTPPVVYIALQQFCEHDERPRRLLIETGFEVRQNTLGHRLTREEMPDALRDADAIIAGVEPYEAALLAALPRVRCISRCGVGTDAIDLKAAHRQGVAVYTSDEEVVEPVAQLTLAMILALARNIPQHVTEARAGVWKKRTGALLSDWTIGLVGFGRIGRRVARYLQPFAPRIVVADPRLTGADVPDPVRLCDLPALLRESDVVSLHASRGPREGALIGREELAAMKRGSYLVNTARGFLLDEAALHEALVAGRLAGAALDVFEEEPYRGPLSRLPQALCTPHIATLTRASRAAMELRCARQIVEHFASAPAATPGLRSPG